MCFFVTLKNKTRKNFVLCLLRRKTIFVSLFLKNCNWKTRKMCDFTNDKTFGANFSKFHLNKKIGQQKLLLICTFERLKRKEDFSLWNSIHKYLVLNVVVFSIICYMYRVIFIECYLIIFKKVFSGMVMVHKFFYV